MAADRPRKPTIVLGAELKDDRSVQRRHVGYESPEPPPDSAISDWPPEVRTDPGWPRVDRVPPSSDAVQLKIPGKLVVAMIGAIVTAALGGVGFTKATEKPAASPELVGELKTDIKALREDVREIRDSLRETRGAQAQRWDLISALLCKVNGKAWARGIDCDALDVEFEPLPVDAVYVAPKFKAKAQWPYLPRTP